MKKIILLLFACLSAFFSLDAEERLVLHCIAGPSAIGMIRLIETPPRINGRELRVEVLAQQDLMAAGFISGSVRMGLLPPNMAAKIAASGGSVQAAAVTGTGMLSLLTSDSGISRVEDVRGKTIAAAGQGATPDYVMRHILLSRGMEPGKDLLLNYSLPPPEIARSLIAGRISLALLPEPFASMARAGNKNLREVSDIQEEWSSLTGVKNYPMTVLAVDGDFAAKEAGVLNAVLSAARESIEWVTAHPEEAGILAEKHKLGLRARAVAAAIPQSNYVFIPAAEAQKELEALFSVFLKYSPASIGGALPRDGFYFR